ncbi:MAG: efflux RND transporter periplasmic adaptor subunit [Spirochaetaceae bacterium]
MKKILFIGLCLALLTSCNKKEQKELLVEEVKLPIVKIQTIKPEAIRETIKLAGDVVASNSVDIYPDVSGKVSSLLVSEGDYVKKGTIVGYIDRNKPGMNFALSPVESPITGTITQVIGKVGSMSAPSAPLFKIGTLDELEIITNISERDLNRVKKGLNAVITTETYVDELFLASISELNPVVNPITRSLKIKLKLHDTKKVLKPGMFVNITLITKNINKTTVVDRDNIVTRNNQSYIWKFVDDKVFFTPVEFGLQNESSVEITKGLEVGESIVTEGFTYLEDGSEVRTITSKESE